MYTKPQITLKKAEEEEKLTQSLEIEFKVSFANWVADARKIQWKEEKVCACVTVCNCACVCECVCVAHEEMETERERDRNGERKHRDRDNNRENNNRESE